MATCRHSLASASVANRRYGFRSSFILTRLLGANPVAHHLPVSKQAKLSMFPVFSFMGHRNDPNHSPITFRRKRLSSDGPSNDLDHLVHIREDFALPTPHHDLPKGLEFTSKPAIALGVDSKLLRPKLFPGTWSRIVSRAPVLKASVYVDCDFRTRKNDVRTTCRNLVA